MVKEVEKLGSELEMEPFIWSKTGAVLI